MRSTVDDRPSRVVRESRRFGAAAKALGAHVRALRKARSWTLERAAELMQLDLKHLQKIEAGDPPINITLATLLRIADGLDVALADLLVAVPRKGRGTAPAVQRQARRAAVSKRSAF